MTILRKRFSPPAICVEFSKFLGTLVLLSSFVTIAHGQPISSIQLEYRFGLLSEATHYPGIVNQFFVPGTGTSTEQTVRLGYEHEIAELGGRFSWQGGAGVGYSVGNFRSDPFPNSADQFTLQYNGVSLYLRTGMSASLDAFLLGVGAWLGFPLARSLDESLVTGGNTSVIASNAAIDYTRLPAGLRAEVNYAKQLFGQLPITVGLFSELDLEAYRQMGFKATSGGITIHWNIEEVGSILSPY